MTFASLGLRAELLRALTDSGYTIPTPVQAQAIPLILQGHDLLAGAQTGTGKTAGFTLPLLQRLNATTPNPGGSRRPVRALILTPTRELAAQVEESVRTYSKYLPQNSVAIYGGVNIVPQIRALESGVDILVATPGRLLDHIQQRTVDLSRIEILVLDEADRMLDMGFIRDIRKIMALLPVKRQNLLFSATFSDEIKDLADRMLNKPMRVEVARKNAESELVTHAVYLSTRENKYNLLIHLLVDEKVGQALLFTRTKHGANRVAQQLVQDGVSAVPIHGNRSQPQRTKALADFKSGAVRILVATDIAARGLDISQLPHVINFELPNVPEDYVHRIGRTGRAGTPGEALSLVSSDELSYLFAIEKLLKKPITRRTPKDFTPAPRRVGATADSPYPRPEMPQVPQGSGSRGGGRNAPSTQSDSRPRRSSGFGNPTQRPGGGQSSPSRPGSSSSMPPRRPR
ncbi:MAG: DEAD/DEAH box helicase [Chthonomonadaceae bacterium]|nr:DEAD/DEAH box helicase [Chthonomonadaceae bacterium]